MEDELARRADEKGQILDEALKRLSDIKAWFDAVDDLLHDLRWYDSIKKKRTREVILKTLSFSANELLRKTREASMTMTELYEIFHQDSKEECCEEV